MKEGFLYCRQESLFLITLDYKLMLTSCWEITWIPLLNSISKRMDLWGSNYIILGGCVVGLNSDFKTIPILFLSFLKIYAIF